VKTAEEILAILKRRAVIIVCRAKQVREKDERDPAVFIYSAVYAELEYLIDLIESEDKTETAEPGLGSHF
jgi:hypothetical protein